MLGPKFEMFWESNKNGKRRIVKIVVLILIKYFIVHYFDTRRNNLLQTSQENHIKSSYIFGKLPFFLQFHCKKKYIMQIKRNFRQEKGNSDEAVFQPILPLEGRSFNFIQKGNFRVSWHFHPEIEITLIEKGEGFRLIGHNEEAFSSGDLVLLGSNLPHVWRLDKRWEEGSGEFKHHSKVIQFKPNSWGAVFFDKPELIKIKELLKNAKRGMHFKGKICEYVRNEILNFSKLNDAKQFISILSILEKMSQGIEKKDFDFLTSKKYINNLNVEIANSGRLANVMNHIIDNFTEKITLEDVANIAGMNPSSFSRYFKSVIGKTFKAYLIERRINAACKKLVRTEENIAQIALECGYNTLSNFNKHFKGLKSMSASEYRKRNKTHF